MNFEKLITRTRQAQRNSMRDDRESQERGMAGAKAWQDREFEKIFDGKTGPGPSESTLASSRNWPKTSMTETSPTDVYARARSQAAEADNSEPPTLAELGLEDMGGMQDASPMRFYSGRPWREGRRLHNEFRVSMGQAPLSEGSK